MKVRDIIKINTKYKLTFNQHIANYVTSNYTTSDLPKIGIAGLQLGLESVSLAILAGMSEKDNAFELEYYFKIALDDLNFELPEIRQAAIELALFYTDEILARRIDPVDGVNKIICKCLESYNFFDESKEYGMDSIDFETIYVLYWTYNDLIEANHSWDLTKTNDELIQETKENIIDELKIWKEKIK